MQRLELLRQLFPVDADPLCQQRHLEKRGMGRMKHSLGREGIQIWRLGKDGGVQMDRLNRSTRRMSNEKATCRCRAWELEPLCPQCRVHTLRTQGALNWEAHLSPGEFLRMRN